MNGKKLTINTSHEVSINAGTSINLMSPHRCVKAHAEAVRCVKSQRNSMHLLSHGTSRASSDLRGECAIAWNLRRECRAGQPRTSTYLGQIRCCATAGAIATSHVPSPIILQTHGQPPSVSLHHGSKAARVSTRGYERYQL